MDKKRSKGRKKGSREKKNMKSRKKKWAIHNLSFEAPIYIFIILKEEDGTLRE